MATLRPSRPNAATSAVRSASGGNARGSPLTVRFIAGPPVGKLVTPQPSRYKTAESTAEPNVETDLCAERAQSQPAGRPRTRHLWHDHARGRARPERGA